MAFCRFIYAALVVSVLSSAAIADVAAINVGSPIAASLMSDGQTRSASLSGNLESLEAGDSLRVNFEGNVYLLIVYRRLSAIDPDLASKVQRQDPDIGRQRAEADRRLNHALESLRDGKPIRSERIVQTMGALDGSELPSNVRLSPGLGQLGVIFEDEDFAMRYFKDDPGSPERLLLVSGIDGSESKQALDIDLDGDADSIGPVEASQENLDQLLDRAQDLLAGLNARYESRDPLDPCDDGDWE